MVNESANTEGNEINIQLVDGVCVVTADDATANLTAIVIDKPDVGEIVELAVLPGQKYFFDFNENNVQSFVQEGEDLTLNFADGSSIILQGFGVAASGVLPATLAFSDALSTDELAGLIQVVDTTPAEEELQAPQGEVREEQVADIQPASGEDASEQVANIQPASGDEPSAADLANIETAAGDEGGDSSGGNSGFGFGSRFEAQGVNGIDDVGPLERTLLNYGVDLPTHDLLDLGEKTIAVLDDQPFILNPRAVDLDETNLGPTPVHYDGHVDVDFGNDGPGVLCADGNFDVTGSLPNVNSITSFGSVLSS